MIYNYSRRHSRPVRVGNAVIGGANPILIQSMTNTSTLDTEASAQQAINIARAGGELVRLTTQGVREAANLRNIKQAIRDVGCNVPISADVHFNPKAAFEAALHADKVRINPGNFVDAARTFQKLEFTDEEYAAEIDRIRKALIPFLQLCAEHGTAVRLGVNHGSLSDRIMSRYGNTPEGMVESVMEYLRIAREVDFNDIVISIKSSNTVVMVQTVRLLADVMQQEGMDYPLHIGVTEAGDAEDGRIKSAVGIGALLHDGLGDTIRVSLSEPPENEIPVALLLRDHILRRAHAPLVPLPTQPPSLHQTQDQRPNQPQGQRPCNLTPNASSLTPPSSQGPGSCTLTPPPSNLTPKTFSTSDPACIGQLAADIDNYLAQGGSQPITIQIFYDPEEYSDLDTLRICAGADFGALLLSGYGDDIAIDAPAFDAQTLEKLRLDILQAARRLFYKTEFIACPGCGRTLFDLPSTLKEVKEEVAKLGLTGLKIGVMGCIVNGPGEMADADYGYVGAGPGRVSIYKGKQLLIKNIPTAEALPALLSLLKSQK